MGPLSVTGRCLPLYFYMHYFDKGLKDHIKVKLVGGGIHSQEQVCMPRPRVNSKLRPSNAFARVFRPFL